MYASRCDILVTFQLSCADEKGKELVVIKTPNTVRACGLKIVRRLNLAHESNVLRKDHERKTSEGGRGQTAETIEAEEIDHKIEFVARTIVNPCAITEGVDEVSTDFEDGRRWY